MCPIQDYYAIYSGLTPNVVLKPMVIMTEVLVSRLERMSYANLMRSMILTLSAAHIKLSKMVMNSSRGASSLHYLVLQTIVVNLITLVL